MTKSKIERIRQELLEQYGDIVIMRLYSRKDKSLLKEVMLTEITLRNTADVKDLLKLIKEKKPRSLVV